MTRSTAEAGAAFTVELRNDAIAPSAAGFDLVGASMFIAAGSGGGLFGPKGAKERSSSRAGLTSR